MPDSGYGYGYGYGPGAGDAPPSSVQSGSGAEVVYLHDHERSDSVDGRSIAGAAGARRRGGMVADRVCGAGLGDGRRGRGDPADRIGAFHGSVASGVRGPSAGRRGRVAARARRVPRIARVSARQSRDVPRRVQAHLLDGIRPPHAGSWSRRRVPGAVCRLSGDACDSARDGSAARRRVRPRGRPGRARLVHGQKRAHRRAPGEPVSPRGPSLACGGDLRLPSRPRVARARLPRFDARYRRPSLPGSVAGPRGGGYRCSSPWSWAHSSPG